MDVTAEHVENRHRRCQINKHAITARDRNFSVRMYSGGVAISRTTPYVKADSPIKSAQGRALQEPNLCPN